MNICLNTGLRVIEEGCEEGPMLSQCYRILSIEDDALRMERVSRMLKNVEGSAFEVTNAGNIGRALTEAASSGFDAILWHWSGIGGDDLDALHRFRLQNDSLPVVVLISEKQTELGKRAVEMGADDYLPMEVLNPDLLHRALRYVIERNRAEIASRQSQGRFDDLFEHTKDILFTVDIDGRVTSVNKTAEEVMGWSRSEALEMNIKSLVAPEHVGLCTEMMRRILNQEPLQPFEIVMLGKDGRKVLLEVSARLLRSDGEKDGVQGIARDVTERRNLEYMVRQSQKLEAIGRLSGGLAHDFNNLLCVISGYTDLLTQRLKPNDVAIQHLAQIRKATNSAAALTRQLLAFSRRQVFYPRIVELNAIVVDVEKLLGRLIDERIEFYLALDSALGRVRVDPVQIEQVIINVALNARDAMPHGGRLTMETSNIDIGVDRQSKNFFIPAGKYVLLAMTDTGCGMNEETQSHIFEPFYTTKDLGSGTGLGLATVYGIVKQSGGFIGVHSQEGQGTTFKIYLPRIDSLLAVAHPTGRPVEASKVTETILVVEDAEGLREIIGTFLTDSGYAVLAAANGDEALRLAQSFDGAIDLLLTDVVMPRMGGEQLVEQMKAIRPQTRVLYMSGYPTDGIVQAGILANRVTLIEKPFTREILMKRVRELLDEPPQAN